MKLSITGESPSNLLCVEYDTTVQPANIFKSANRLEYILRIKRFQFRKIYF